MNHSILQIKDIIINQLSTVKVESLKQVTQVAAIVALATEQKDEISIESQVTFKTAVL